MNPCRLPFVELPLSLERTSLSEAPAEPDPQVCRVKFQQRYQKSHRSVILSLLSVHFRCWPPGQPPNTPFRQGLRQVEQKSAGILRTGSSTVSRTLVQHLGQKRMNTIPVLSNVPKSFGLIQLRYRLRLNRMFSYPTTGAARSSASYGPRDMKTVITLILVLIPRGRTSEEACSQGRSDKADVSH
jgi:hypothetical protein